MRKALLAFIVTSLFSLQTNALQIKRVVDNETVTATISALDTTRIFVEGDRIKTIRGVKGAYERENDEVKGEVYITPHQQSAFTILIETELGRHFTLLLNPLSVPSDTLMLIPKGVNVSQAHRAETASGYELMISHFIRAMTNGISPEGYRVIEVDKSTEYNLGNIATLHLKTIFEGLDYQGEIFELHNKKSTPITLDEKQFYKPGTVAISFEAITVPPNKNIQVMRVVHHV